MDPDERVPCGARTRAGTPCRRVPVPGRTRCRLHGGQSLVGIASPRFRHGQYSRCHLSRIVGVGEVLRAAGCRVETLDDWQRVGRSVPACRNRPRERRGAAGQG